MLIPVVSGPCVVLAIKLRLVALLVVAIVASSLLSSDSGRRVGIFVLGAVVVTGHQQERLRARISTCKP